MAFQKSQQLVTIWDVIIPKIKADFCSSHVNESKAFEQFQTNSKKRNMICFTG